ncbi:unnamed protein product [Lepeophtheirus salmonis]|uniref:(salmon louse) hypothetical protein n=1 Tax=Lepeophtheirus salmonis TaxID=72036 RepID=A0A7R8CS91_LEPSM|nr:unnamed protein product [Lepeophtheirus salmonis]CAF2877436.1 unnamed protein product [Lepeophtheirus salmonis]
MTDLDRKYLFSLHHLISSLMEYSIFQAVPAKVYLEKEDHAEEFNYENLEKPRKEDYYEDMVFKTNKQNWSLKEASYESSSYEDIDISKNITSSSPSTPNYTEEYANISPNNNSRSSSPKSLEEFIKNLPLFCIWIELIKIQYNAKRFREDLTEKRSTSTSYAILCIIIFTSATAFICAGSFLLYQSLQGNIMTLKDRPQKVESSNKTSSIIHQLSEEKYIWGTWNSWSDCSSNHCIPGQTKVRTRKCYDLRNRREVIIDLTPCVQDDSSNVEIALCQC